ncbi:hypothetical protein NHQ30_005712 [Ciborinia camelliae]|nr:hypothetical protein NHQ30_005712 [Ciborinia camelliae]
MDYCTKKTHIPGMRGPLIALRAGQLIIALVILCLSIYGLCVELEDAFTKYRIYLTRSYIRFVVSTAATGVTCLYILIASAKKPVIYNYWAIFALDFASVILWAVSIVSLSESLEPSYRVLITHDSSKRPLIDSPTMVATSSLGCFEW